MNLLVQGVEDVAYGNAGIVAVQPIEVDHVSLEMLQAQFNIVPNIVTAETRHVHTAEAGMRPFGRKDDAGSISSLAHPRANRAFAGVRAAGEPVGIHPCGIDAIATAANI